MHVQCVVRESVQKLGQDHIMQHVLAGRRWDDMLTVVLSFKLLGLTIRADWELLRHALVGIQFAQHKEHACCNSRDQYAAGCRSATVQHRQCN